MAEIQIIQTNSVRYFHYDENEIGPTHPSLVAELFDIAARILSEEEYENKLIDDMSINPDSLTIRIFMKDML